MSQTVRFRRLALAEFDDAADWYERRQAGRGDTFTLAVRRVLAGIADAPELHAKVRGSVREACVVGFPYAIYYVVEPTRVTVLAVFHTSRDPSAWQGRV